MLLQVPCPGCCGQGAGVLLQAAARDVRGDCGLSWPAEAAVGGAGAALLAPRPCEAKEGLVQHFSMERVPGQCCPAGVPEGLDVALWAGAPSQPQWVCEFRFLLRC